MVSANVVIKEHSKQALLFQTVAAEFENDLRTLRAGRLKEIIVGSGREQKPRYRHVSRLPASTGTEYLKRLDTTVQTPLVIARTGS